MLNIYFGKQTVELKKDFAKVSKVGLLTHLKHFDHVNYDPMSLFWS